MRQIRVAIWLVAFACAIAGEAMAQPVATRVMQGLDNPRGLAIGPEGALYVVEAGSGGTGPCTELRGATQCFGPTGALTRLWRGRTERVLTGLPSYISTTGEVSGPHDVSFMYRGGAYLTMGLGNGGGDPNAARAAFGEGGERFGRLLWISTAGRANVLADLAQYEFEANPAGGPTDSNPFGVLAEPDGIVVADAGANALLRVDHRGRITTLAVLPPVPGSNADSVATSIARGPDGAYYAGELTGVPFAAGAARVFRIVPGEPPQVFATGFTTIIDLAFGADGSLYVLQHSTGPMFFAGPGNIIRVAPDGARSIVYGGLTRPTALVVDRTGTIYVTNNGIASGTGEVLRIRP